MSMQPSPFNQIEVKKQQVRRDARSGLVCVAGGLGGGLALTLLATNWFWLILGFVVAVAGGIHYGRKVRKAIEKDPNSPY